MEILEIKTAAALEEVKKERFAFLARMPAALYHGDTAVNCSSLKVMVKSPGAYLWNQLNPPEPTEAMNFGTAFHALAEGTYKDEVAVIPELNRRTKAGREAYEELKKGGKVLVTKKEDALIHMMMVNLLGKEDYADLHESKPQRELSAFSYNGDYDLWLKARADVASFEKGLLLDYKTTQDASPDEFRRDARKFQYDIQNAFYLDVFNAATDGAFDRFLFAACEKKEPNDAAIYELSDLDVQGGRAKYQQALDTLVDCLETGEFPGYPGTVQKLSLSWRN